MTESRGLEEFRLARRCVLVALFLSGVASIINQVVWQRALKLFLGGSEAISSLVVVFVFMLGLGVGSGIAGARARSLTRPLRAFALVELALFAVNAGIAVLLSLDLGESIYSAQRLAVSAAIPLRVVYAFGALGMLLPPTILMGATLPLAAEGCQRQLGATESKLITVLLALNTVGAFVGAIGSSFFLLPWFGQRASLGVAALFNLAAGITVLSLALFLRRASPAVEGAAARSSGRRPFSLEEKLGCVLGFLSLGYEMYLLRLLSLAHEPRPYTFACTLSFFLLFWSLGVWLAGRTADRATAFLGIGAALVAVMPGVYVLDRWISHFALYRGGLVYFLPCVCFGAMYGTLVSRAAAEWGRDVGRFYASNTAGSCLGILFFSLVGYEIPQDYNAFLIALGLLFVLFELRVAGRGANPRIAFLGRPIWARVAIGGAGLALLGMGLASPYSDFQGQVRTFWGRDGVVEVFSDRAVWIDGMWHSRLSDGSDHIGSPYNWMMAAVGVLAHSDEDLTDALVVGNGIGITASTLAQVPGLRVDAYEINRTLAEILTRYPDGTLHSGSNPRIRIRWQDGRSGLALDPKRYDLIVSAPLHLRAAGSSTLLSREYLELARRRLETNGVMVLYSHEGRPEQSELVRATVRSVFAYSETFLDGMLMVASDAPIRITEESIRERLQRSDPLSREMAMIDDVTRRKGEGGFFGSFDVEPLPVRESPYRVTDDHPLVEYAAIAARLLNQSAPPLPEPGSE